MLQRNRRRVILTRIIVTALTLGLGASVLKAQASSLNLEAMRSALIPKKEVGADVFIEKNPTYDGRGVVIAVFDTGVDPAAAGMAVTTTGARKVVDIIDGTGSGDVDTSTVVKSGEDGKLAGLSGRALALPDGILNPAGEYRIGLKAADELFTGAVLSRLKTHLESEWQAELSLIRAERAREKRDELKAAQKKAGADRTRAEADLVAREDQLIALENGLLASGPGPLYDCVVWNDGTDWRVLIDTDRDGDLADEKALRPFGVAGEYGTFDSVTNTTFGVQVYEGGDLLSVVTVSGTHGTHVASIAASHYPESPERNGVAPGAQILSIKIGDIRTRGSSYGLSERRAMAAAARYGVDVMNASWGGQSAYQDGGDSNSELYNRLVERYGVLAVMSAGNEGPAYSTAGSAGGEASRVLGVGAYGSAEMARVLYNAVKQSPDAALQFSSRGPTKDGDIGVDVMAPGAAWASYSAESIMGAEMINGTSMSSPNAAGVAALVISAAKQNNVDHSAVKVRQALMLGATPLLDDPAATRGRGMINAGGGWAKLQALQHEPAFGAYYDVTVSGGTFFEQGRGLYLRGIIEEPRQRVGVSVTPAWGDDVTTEARYAFETDLVLSSTVDWLEAPDYLHMANGRQSFSMFVSLPEQDETSLERGGVLTGEIEARVASNPDLGVVFSIPVTVVRPASPAAFVNHHRKMTVDVKPAETARVFLAVPAGVERLDLEVKHTAADPVSRRFFVQALTVSAESHQGRFKDDRASWVDEGDSFTMHIPVQAGGVTELALNQYFYSDGDTTLELDLKWVGVGAGTGTVTLEPNQGWAPVELVPTVDGDVKVSTELTHAVNVYLPKQTTDFYDDERGVLPPTALHPGSEKERFVRLRYELNFEKPIKAALLSQQDYDLSDGIAGGRLTVVHESGEVLHTSFPSERQTIDFPKGKVSVYSEYTAFGSGLVDSIKTLPLKVGVPLKPAKSLGVGPNFRSRFDGSRSSDLSLKAGRDAVIMLEDTIVEDAAKLEPKPDYLVGELKFEDEDEEEITTLPLLYFPGLAPSKVTDQDAKPKPAKDLKSDETKLSDAITALQLAFVRDHRHATDQATIDRRSQVLTQLRAERTEDPLPLIEAAIDGAIAAGFASDIWGKPAKPEDAATDAKDAVAEAPSAEVATPTAKALFELLVEAEALAGPDKVSQFYGAKPVSAPGDLEARDKISAEAKEMASDRDALAVINRLRTDLHRAAGEMDAAWQSWTEIQRWESEPADDTKALEVMLLKATDMKGLALKALNERIAKDPFKAELLKERIALYRELGWERMATQQELLLKRREATQASLKKL